MSPFLTLALSVTLAWDASPGPNAIGYRVYWGTASHIYWQSLDVGSQTTGTVSTLASGTNYFFAVTAYNANGVESPFSNEAVYTAPVSPTPTPGGPTATVSPSPTRTPSPTPSPTQGPSPTAGPTAAGPTITSLVLVRNSPAGQSIMPMTNGTTINLATLPTQDVNVQAFGSAGTTSIAFTLTTSQGFYDHNEATSPFALCGDWDPCPANTLLGLGSHVLQVTASAGSQAGPSLNITFAVISPTPTPTATASPSVSPSPSPTRSPSPSPTRTPAPAPTASPTPSPSPTPMLIAIGGQITVCGSNSPAPGVMVTISGSVSGSTVTDSKGIYSFSVPPGSSYSVTPIKQAVPPGSPAISTVDAIAAMRYYLLKEGITCVPAADVTGEGNIDSIDVIGIQRFAVGLPSGLCGHYRFDPVSPTLDFSMVLIGDVQ